MSDGGCEVARQFVEMEPLGLCEFIFFLGLQLAFPAVSFEIEDKALFCGCIFLQYVHQLQVFFAQRNTCLFLCFPNQASFGIFEALDIAPDQGIVAAIGLRLSQQQDTTAIVENEPGF